MKKIGLLMSFLILMAGFLLAVENRNALMAEKTVGDGVQKYSEQEDLSYYNIILHRFY